MARGEQAQPRAPPSRARELGQHRPRPLGEALRRLQQVETGDEVGVRAQRRQLLPQQLGELGEEPPALGLGVLPRLLQAVVALDDGDRLEVEAAAGRRAAVHEPGHAPARAGLEDEHEPPLAHRHGLFREQLAVLLHQALEVLVERLALAADGAAQPLQLGRGVLAHLAAAVEHLADLPAQRLGVGKRGRARRERGHRRIGGGDAISRAAAVMSRRSASATTSRPESPGEAPAARASSGSSGVSKLGTSAPAPSRRPASS